MKTIKENFTEIFTLLAWISLLGFVLYCTITESKSDSIRDAWNILILIAGFVWGSKHNRAPEQKVTTEFTSAATTITSEPVKPNEHDKS